MIDWDRIRELRHDVGEDEFGVILRLFLDEFEGVLNRLRGDDTGRLLADLSFLKDGARTLGFRRFAILCAELERSIAALAPRTFCPEALAHCYAASKQGLIRGLLADPTVPELCLV